LKPSICILSLDGTNIRYGTYVRTIAIGETNNEETIKNNGQGRPIKPTNAYDNRITKIRGKLNRIAFKYALEFENPSDFFVFVSNSKSLHHHSHHRTDY